MGQLRLQRMKIHICSHPLLQDRHQIQGEFMPITLIGMRRGRFYPLVRFTLCPEGAENMSLGSQVPDLCF